MTKNCFIENHIKLYSNHFILGYFPHYQTLKELVSPITTHSPSPKEGEVNMRAKHHREPIEYHLFPLKMTFHMRPE